MKYWILIILVINVFGCSKKISSCKKVKGEAIVINNYAIGLKTKSKTVEIHKHIKLDKICNLLFNNGTYIKDSGVKHNTGFIEVRFKENKDLYFYLIYTELNGPIIQFNDNYWKNDELVEIIIETL